MKKVIKLFRQILVVAVLWCLAMLSAQEVGTTHIVERGETLQSISQKYGVTEQQIIDQNPDAAQFIYVGMELNIPAAKTSMSNDNIGTAMPAMESSGSRNTILTQTGNSVNSYNAESSFDDNETWSHWGLSYVSDFNNFDKGFYGLYWEVAGPSGFGGYLLMGANFGLVKPASFLGRFGPEYAVAFQENIRLSFPLCVNMTTFDVIKETSMIGDRVIEKKDTKIAWGLSLTPKISFKIDRVTLGFGLDINYFFKRKEKTNILGNEREETYFGKTNLGLVLSVGI